MCGDISCCNICFFSAAFRVGVELLRFFLGEGEPTCELVSLDGGFSVGKWEDIAEVIFGLLFFDKEKFCYRFGKASK
jgi:hypothetical protein